MNIEEISDHLEIERLMVKYVDAIDTKSWELLDEVFTSDAFRAFDSDNAVSNSLISAEDI